MWLTVYFWYNKRCEFFCYSSFLRDEFVKRHILLTPTQASGEKDIYASIGKSLRIMTVSFIIGLLTFTPSYLLWKAVVGNIFGYFRNSLMFLLPLCSAGQCPIYCHNSFPEFHLDPHNHSLYGRIAYANKKNFARKNMPNLLY